tara:strand:+ start:315 stop:707 length:393 start_codon:yes stop_codon:yes gene_type:complete
MRVLIGKYLLEELRFQSDPIGMGEEAHHVEVYNLVTKNPNEPIEVSRNLVETVFGLEDLFGEPLSKVDPKLWKDVKQFYIDIGVVRVADPTVVIIELIKGKVRERNEVTNRCFTKGGIHYIYDNSLTINP